MQFVFSGFKQTVNVRQFAYTGIGEDRSRTGFIVTADLDLLRKYQISLQDAPLLCLRLLENIEDAARQRTLIFTEDDMIKLSRTRAADREAAAQKRKHPKPPTDPNRLGEAWRTRPKT